MGGPGLGLVQEGRLDRGDPSLLLGAWSCADGELGRGGDILGLAGELGDQKWEQGGVQVGAGGGGGGLADPVLRPQEWDRKAEDARRDYEKAMKEYSKADSHRG